jgi:hypothetical protein
MEQKSQSLRSESFPQDALFWWKIRRLLKVLIFAVLPGFSIRQAEKGEKSFPQKRIGLLK